MNAFSHPTVSFVPWWDVITSGGTLLTELDKIRAEVNGAILVFNPEIPANVHGNSVEIPNLNVLFEFAYFYSQFGPQRAAIIKYGEFYLPSNMWGRIHIPGSKHFKANAVVKVGKRTTNEFNKWIAHF